MRYPSLLLAGLLAILAVPAVADTPQFDLTIKDHRFEPETLVVPVGTKVKLKISNLDRTPEEFESHELNREKVIGGGKTAVVFVGPLEAGEYRFFGEFNQDTAQGRIVAE
ncbi:MAG: cupredoxin domain-containing protein [Gammaproteobacteria bacterium]|jgi:plastocyanin